MSKLDDVLSEWEYHINGGYYTKEILDGDILKEARAELAALTARVTELEAERDELLEQPRDALRKCINAAALAKGAK